MFSAVNSKTVALALVFAFMAIPSLAKPSNWSFRFDSGFGFPPIQFDFTGCSTSNSDVVCTGNFRSLRGEAGFNMRTDEITITDSKGKIYQADQININNYWSCLPNSLSGCPSLTFVEGVTYKTSFVFREISLPSKKVALFRLYSNWSRDEAKVRNIEVVNSDSISQQSQSILVKQKPVNSLRRNVSSSYRLGYYKSIKFDFHGCSKTSSSDVVCIADFLSLSGDQEIVVGPRMSDINRTGASPGVIIVNSEGQSYLASEVSVNDNWSCSVDASCPGGESYNPGKGRITLVEGVNYKTTFTFRDISLPSRKLSLFSFTSPDYLNIRNIQVSE
jgi:hypothetical protein